MGKATKLTRKLMAWHGLFDRVWPFMCHGTADDIKLQTHQHTKALDFHVYFFPFTMSILFKNVFKKALRLTPMAGWTCKNLNLSVNEIFEKQLL